MYALEQVRAELLAICDAHPDEKGRLPGRHGGYDNGCVYFANSSGRMELTPENIPSATPICIVGRWVATHLELLNDEFILGLLAANVALNTDLWIAGYVDEGAEQLLLDAQRRQDMDDDDDSALTFGELRGFIAEAVIR